MGRGSAPSKACGLRLPRPPISTPPCLTPPCLHTPLPSQALPAALARLVSGSRSLSSPPSQSQSHCSVLSQHGWLSDLGMGLGMEDQAGRGCCSEH